MSRPDPAPASVTFPTDEHGSRSSQALGRGVVADALREVDPPGALAAEQETSWRSGYLDHFRRLVVSGLVTPDAARTIARDGLSSLHRRMRVVGPDDDVPLAEWPEVATDPPLETVEVDGSGEAGAGFSLPYRGRRLRGDDLRRHLEQWTLAGVIEPSAADAVDQVVRHPEWLRLEGRTLVVLGAGAEMGPLRAVTAWGARVAAVDLPRREAWQQILQHAGRGAGTLLVPVWPGQDPDHLETAAGLDVLSSAPAVAEWVRGLPGEVVLGNYVYADGATNLRAAAALDWLTRTVLEERDDVSLAFLATPTDVFAVPGEAVDASVRSYAERSRVGRTLGRPLRTLSGGRLLQRNYRPGSDPGVVDSLVPQQGPNYALAKRVHRWRALQARAEGVTVSMNVAPPTRTRSVVKNRALAAAYAGAHRFGVEVFDPATSNVLMAALLVHDLHTGGGPGRPHPWQDEAHGAVHGGLWRTAYAPRSALGLAALLGWGAARG